MLNVTDLRQGTIYQEGGKLYRVQEYKHRKIARGGGKIVVKVRDLDNGTILRKTYNSGTKLDKARVETKKVNYLYREGDNFVFMDNANYDQFSVGEGLVGDSADFLKEGLEVRLRMFEDRIVDIVLPLKVPYTVAEAPPDARGDSSQTGVKEVVLKNSLKVKAPMFIKNGDEIVVDTRSGAYVERR